MKTSSKRIKNFDLLEQIRKQPCLVCRKISGEVHHIKSRGSGGHDIESNLIPLCRVHHTEVHKIGLNRFSEKYKEMSLFLTSNGWEFSASVNKWKNF